MLTQRDVFGLASLLIAMHGWAANVWLDVTYPVFMHYICSMRLLTVMFNPKAHL